METVFLRPQSLDKSMRVLEMSRTERQIRAFQLRKVKSRSEQYQRPSMPSKKSQPLPIQNLGEVFEAAQSIFRNSLAFHFPSELTIKPAKRQLNNLWRSFIIDRQYQQAKTDEIKRLRYVNNYRLKKVEKAKHKH